MADPSSPQPSGPATFAYKQGWSTAVIVFGAFAAVVGLAFISLSAIGGLLFFAVGAWFLFAGIRSRGFRVSLNREGIATPGTGSIPWSSVRNVEAKAVHGKYRDSERLIVHYVNNEGASKKLVIPAEVEDYIGLKTRIMWRMEEPDAPGGRTSV